MRGFLTSSTLVALIGLVPVASRAEPFAYVANNDDESVSVIDTAVNEVVATITVGSEPRNPAVSPNGSRVYVPVRHADQVAVIDGVTNTLITSIDDDDFDEPYGAIVSPNGLRVYIANKEGGGSSSGSLSVIDALNNSVLLTIDDACFVSPEWVAINPTGAFAYVVSRQGNSVCVVNTATNTVVDEVDVGDEPRSAVVTCDGAFVYVANNGSGDVTKFRTSDNTVVDTIPTGGFPRNMAITPDCSKIYVPLQSSDGVAVISLPNDTVTTIPIASSSPYGAAVTKDSKRLYVTDENNDRVFVFDVETDTEITGTGLPVEVGSTPRGIASAAGTQAPLSPAPALSTAGIAMLIAALLVFGMRRTRST